MTSRCFLTWSLLFRLLPHSPWSSSVGLLTIVREPELLDNSAERPVSLSKASPSLTSLNVPQAFRLQTRSLKRTGRFSMASSQSAGRRHVPWVYRSAPSGPEAVANKARPKARLTPAPAARQAVPARTATPPTVGPPKVVPRAPQAKGLPAHLAYGPLPSLGGYGRHFKPSPWQHTDDADASRPAGPPPPKVPSHPAQSAASHQGPVMYQQPRAQADPKEGAAPAPHAQSHVSFPTWQRQRNEFAAHSGKSGIPLPRTALAHKSGISSAQSSSLSSQPSGAAT